MVKQIIKQIIPVIEAYKPNKKLRKKNRDLYNIEVTNKVNQIDERYLLDDYNAAIDTKNRLEDKAKTIIAALTIAITLVLNLSRVIDKIIVKIPIKYFNYVVFILAILCVLYMLIAGIMSIQVLIKENIVYPLSLEDRTSKNLKSILQSINLNVNQNLIRNNIIYASYRAIRNSVVCLVIVFGLSIFPYNISEEKNVDTYQYSDVYEIIYGEDVVEWIKNNPNVDVDIEKIIHGSIDNVNEVGENIIYDKGQGVIITIELINNSYLIKDIKNNIIEVY